MLTTMAHAETPDAVHFELTASQGARDDDGDVSFDIEIVRCSGVPGNDCQERPRAGFTMQTAAELAGQDVKPPLPPAVSPDLFHQGMVVRHLNTASARSWR